ncbi:integrase core domain-containing protein [Diaminobutyricimonas sp. LJ205]|uniref:integrase core domain-containing protein n=1 Tax=Diaminobutyricimonas sp. LJ205 TaxID=2683590 RepID=UPI001E57E24D|nr:integrase core domain-containing protein [Diaminobutyricimonas sp. LJ205]
MNRSWVYKLKARYEAEGEAAFEARSRRPKTSPTAIPAATVELIVRLRNELATAGHDAGPDTIAWHLQHRHDIVVSVATISRYLTRAGLVTPHPKKRPKSSYIRFQAALPNETWQSDFTHYRLADGRDLEILTWLDDHSRYALSITAHNPVTADAVANTFRRTVTSHGIPASTLTDNGMVFTTRLSGRGRHGGRNALEHELRRLHVSQKNSSPGHPTTCGKVERFQQTMKNWLRAQPVQPATLAELQQLLDQFQGEYNHRRPHRSLRTGQPRQPPTPANPRPCPPPAATPTPTTGSATTGSTKPAASPSATTADYTTSASAEPTPEPTSCSSSRTSTSASSTRSPARCSANSPWTRTATTNPAEPSTGRPLDQPRNDKGRTHANGSGLSPIS